MMRPSPTSSTPRSCSYEVPSSASALNLGSRRRLTIFWLLAKVQNATCPSRKPYHMATRCGCPVGPILATFSVRVAARKASTSSGDMVKDLEGTLQGLGKDVELLIYEDADHAFFNDTRPEVHKPEQSQQAWDRTIALFRETL